MAPVKVWLDDPSVIFAGRGALEFWPTSAMPAARRVNAISRFLFYAGIMLALYYKRPEMMAAGIVAAAAYAALSKRKAEVYSPFIRGEQRAEIAAAQTAAPRKQTALNAWGNPMPGDPVTLEVAPFDADAAQAYYFTNMPRDLEDIGDRSTLPYAFKPLADRRGFADYSALAKGLYGDMGACKEDRRQCTGFEQ